MITKVGQFKRWLGGGEAQFGNWVDHQIKRRVQNLNRGFKISFEIKAKGNDPRKSKR